MFRWAAFEMGKVGRQAMDAAGVRPDEIDVFLPHQANSRINEVLAKSLELRPDAVVANDIEHTGNTSAASIPLAMAEAAGDRRGQGRRSGPAARLRRGPELCRAGRADAERLTAPDLVVALVGRGLPVQPGLQQFALPAPPFPGDRERGGGAPAQRGEHQMPSGIAMIRANSTATTICCRRPTRRPIRRTLHVGYLAFAMKTTTRSIIICGIGPVHRTP